MQYNNGTQNTDSQAALTAEFDALQTEITRITDNTKFNGVALFAGAALTFQVGSDAADTIDVVGHRPGGRRHLRVAVITDSTTVQTAITAISTQRGELGAIQNRFEHTINSVNVAIENLSASESRIRDTDMAQRDDELHPLADPVAGRHRHARAGQPGPAGRPVAAALTWSSPA